jgi:hypothetical protein
MLGLITAGTQAALGIGQTIAGMVKKKPAIPEYDIPQEVYDNMTDAEYWALEGLPPAQKQQFIEQSQRAGATALSRGGERKGGLGLISSIAQQERDAATQMLSMDAQARMSNLDRVFQARERVAAHEGIKQEWARDKALTERQEVNELIGSGLQNIMGAGATGAGVEAYSEEDGFISRFLKDRRTKKAAFAEATAPGIVKPPPTPGIFSTGTYDKLPFG